MLDPTRHNYFQKLMALCEQGRVKPGVTCVDVYHDDWCGIYRGDYCNCNPEVRLYELSLHDPRRN